MSSIKEVLPAANQILKKYYLCDSCLGRLFSKRLKLSSNRLLGKKSKRNFPKSSKKCYVCKNLLDNLASYLELMLESSLNHGFSSFVVGAMIQPSIIDRDDFLRSKYRLRGIDGVKTDITREISKQFAKKTKKKLDFLDPDITFTLNLKESTCLLRSKPLSLQGRYNKYKRGFSQKQKSCENCYGKGCRNCTFHGFTESESVEAKISQFLFSKFGGTIAKFTWIGGDDKSSLVLGMGRPFFVRIQNPTRRKAKLPKKIKLESLIINNFKIIAEVPKKPLRFRSIIEIKITTENNLQPSSLRKLKKFLEIPIIIY
ncbi:MAG: pseudouridine synthase, partial [Nitrosopumilus sp.]